jgi:hypothetical protein
MEEKDKQQCRVTVRLSPNQMQVLSELNELFGTTYSQLLRMMVLDFITRNDETITNLLNKHDGIIPNNYALPEDS